MSEKNFIHLSGTELNILAAALAEFLTKDLDLKDISRLLLFIHNLCDSINMMALDKERLIFEQKDDKNDKEKD